MLLLSFVYTNFVVTSPVSLFFPLDRGLTIKYFNIKSSFHDQFAKKKKKKKKKLFVPGCFRFTSFSLQNCKSSNLRRSVATKLVISVPF